MRSRKLRIHLARLRALGLRPNHSRVGPFGVLRRTTGSYRRGLGRTTAGEATAHLKTIMAAVKEVSVKAAMASVISELEGSSSLKESKKWH